MCGLYSVTYCYAASCPIHWVLSCSVHYIILYPLGILMQCALHTPAYLCHPKCKGRVRHNRCARQCSIWGTACVGQDTRDKANLHNGRHDVENHTAQDEVNPWALDWALDWELDVNSRPMMWGVDYNRSGNQWQHRTTASQQHVKSKSIANQQQAIVADLVCRGQWLGSRLRFAWTSEMSCPVQEGAKKRD